MRPRKILVAARCSFTLTPEVKAMAEARARALGMDFGPYVAAVVRNDLIRPNADLVLRVERSVKNRARNSLRIYLQCYGNAVGCITSEGKAPRGPRSNEENQTNEIRTP